MMAAAPDVYRHWSHFCFRTLSFHGVLLWLSCTQPATSCTCRMPLSCALADVQKPLSEQSLMNTLSVHGPSTKAILSQRSSRCGPGCAPFSRCTGPGCPAGTASWPSLRFWISGYQGPDVNGDGASRNSVGSMASSPYPALLEVRHGLGFVLGINCEG
jgi:hypothetical protein